MANKKSFGINRDQGRGGLKICDKKFKKFIVQKFLNYRRSNSIEMKEDSIILRSLFDNQGWQE